MREIKFRVWSSESKKMYLPKKGCDFLVRIDGEYFVDEDIVENVGLISVKREDYILMQYTGLKDKSGQEIYELMELNGKYKVVYIAPSYVLYDISTGDIIEYEKQNKYEITREYSPLQKNEERCIDEYILQTKGKKYD